ncbi:MAG: SUMF1/EgtB/PvdO family nonheme iron enzyme [Planctomycetes bacterium]|nr:SUMF1/EgtB/PvdO family nonheme iron enzyme [Planctomycetota bacterium]
MPSEIIAGDFELDRAKLLGKGAWGEVFIGKQVSLNRPVAIKILKKELTADPDFVRRFRREAECLAQLAEEHIIQVYSAGEYQGSPYFIMEFVQGVPLSKCMENGRIFSVDDIIHVAVSVAKAFKAAWNSPAQIVHRDIKPANIMVSYSSSIISPSPEKAEKSASLMSATINIKDTQVKVMDFGLAKLAQGGDHEATMVGTVIGTPKYISPEQGMGNAADIRSDIYSLGIVLYEMATGKIPFEGESAMSMIRHHIYDTAMMISQNMADFPPGMEAIIMKCIQKAPEKRYATPAKLLEDLDAFEKGKPLVHATIDPERAAASGIDATMLAPSSIIYQKRKKKIMATAALVSTVAVLAVLGFWQPWKKPPVIPSHNASNTVTGTDMAGVTTPPTIGSINTSVPEDPLLKELQALYNKANEFYEQAQYDESKKILEEILVRKEDYAPAITLLKEVQKKIDEQNEKLRLIEAMITETLKSIEEAKTKEQNRFNLIIQNIESKDFSAARKETERLIELEDELIPPAATYLQMRVWLISLEGDYLREMKSLLKRFNAMYSKSEILPLAEKLVEDARIKQEELAVDKIISDSTKEFNLSKRAAMLDDFIKANEVNQFIRRVKDKWAEVLREMEANRQKSYKDSIAKANQQRQSQLFKEAYATLESARQYADSFTEIDQLKALTEKEFLDFNGIEPATGQRDSNLSAYIVITNTNDSSLMVLIPAGEFTRGDDNGAPEEKPATKINLFAYYADKLEITNEQFRKFVEEAKYLTDAEVEGFGWVYNDGVLEPVKNASWKDPKGTGESIENILNHPVVQVSWKDAWAYAKWARKRLLTEAEWEKLARSDRQLIFPWGSAYQEKKANTGEDGPGKTAPVGVYNADKSPYECLDITGNVSEWCADYFDPTYYQIRAADNPKGPQSGIGHTIRGGSWISSPTSARLTVRKNGILPGSRSDATKDLGQFWSNYLGFRCARDVVTLK